MGPQATCFKKLWLKIVESGISNLMLSTVERGVCAWLIMFS